jgi:hypothetical protein
MKFFLKRYLFPKLSIFLVLILIFDQIVCNYCGANPNIINTKKNGFKLIGIQMMTRHGDRVPIYTFPYNTKGNAEWYCPIYEVINTFKKIEKNFLKINKNKNKKIENSSNEVKNFENFDRIYKKNYMNNREPLIGNCRLGAL